jgi:tRNA (guanine26-N2/guanine27-N2)-dimethyltransferase
LKQIGTPKVQHVDFDHKIEGCTGHIRNAGPLWVGNLFDEGFLKGAINSLENDETGNYHRKVPEMLEKMVEESGLTDTPFIDLHALFDLHNLAPIKNQIIIGKLKDQGFEASRTHFKPTAITTNATVEEVTRIITEHDVR